MEQTNQWQTVCSDDTAYISPILGNGEVVTTIGPTGFHNGFCPPRETANRTIFWAGRRLNTPTHALIRFGQLTRSLIIDGTPTTDDRWQQTIDYDTGTAISHLTHEDITEETASHVLMTNNLLVFHTQLENKGDRSHEVVFTLTYDFTDRVDQMLMFPHMTHFDFRPGYYGADDTPAPMRLRVQPHDADSSLSVLYHINEQLGEVRVGWHPVGTQTVTNTGGEFTHLFTLAPGEHASLWFWVMLSDRRRYEYFPDFERLQALLSAHKKAWRDYWAQSQITFGDPRLEALRQTCLYAIRCSASPWSIPPAYLATHWEGRTFHDEMYPFLALLSGGYTDLARRIPEFRLNTLPAAISWGGDKGARFPWETLENGQEGGPYGHWMDERFQVGQFSETAWQYYLYTRDTDMLDRLYPLLRECAELFVQDVLVRDASGILKTRLITDFDEQVYPLENAIFTISSAIRTLENAARAAAILDKAPAKRVAWQALAAELRNALPQDDNGAYYRVSDDSAHWHIAQAGVVFPFRVDIHSDRAADTLSRLHDKLRTELNVTVINVPGEPPSKSHWMWAAGIIATGYFLQGRAEEGYALLRRAPESSGPFLSPNERLLPPDDQGYSWVVAKGGSFLPWFTTGAGAVAFACHSMIVQIDNEGTILLNGWPESLAEGHFSRLLASGGVRASGEIAGGRLVSLSVQSDRDRIWRFRLPVRFSKDADFSQVVTAGDPDEHGLARFNCELKTGTTILL